MDRTDRQEDDGRLPLDERRFRCVTTLGQRHKKTQVIQTALHWMRTWISK